MQFYPRNDADEGGSGGGNSGQTARPRRERQRNERRQRLIVAGRACFTELGFSHTSVRHITERADLGHGTFYQYFRSKEQMLTELVAESISELDLELRRPVQDQDPDAWLQAGVLGLLRWFAAHRGVLLALREALNVDPTLMRAWTPARIALEGFVEEYLAWNERIRRSRRLDRSFAITTTVTLFISVAAELTVDLTAGPDRDLRTVADQLVDYCTHALNRLPVPPDA